MKPREWSLVFDSFGAVQGAYTIQPRDSEPRDSTIQVIEMSAYDQLDKSNAELKNALYDLIEHTSSNLENMQHYFENKCCPTMDEVNQCAIADSQARLVYAKFSKQEGR